ncbi:hypothetical protein Nepgr_026428 [Nepenthes gracilis]|uniref:Uncharacterized protein n=1 Tax=Nepenthes gracilis TaxID=150966 RepID=A0AAD3Y211_NEPGR|nr:hypothetical protein Nepgr_026428 [Nepenthes gracilis]
MLPSSLQSSAEEFLSSATKFSVNPAKTVIHSITTSSDLSSSLPHLHTATFSATRRQRRPSQNSRTQSQSTTEIKETEQQIHFAQLPNLRPRCPDLH